MNQDELNSLLKEWQEILRLQDWIIEVELVSREELPDIHIEATVNRDYAHKSAKVLIVQEENRTKNLFKVKKTTEELLVHELIHIHVLFGEYDGEDEYEASVNCLTTAFIKLKGDKK